MPASDTKVYTYFFQTIQHLNVKPSREGLRYIRDLNLPITVPVNVLVPTVLTLGLQKVQG